MVIILLACCLSALLGQDTDYLHLIATCDVCPYASFPNHCSSGTLSACVVFWYLFIEKIKGTLDYDTVLSVILWPGNINSHISILYNISMLLPIGHSMVLS